MSERNRQKKIKMYVTIFTFAALFAIAFGIREQIVDTVANLRQANPWPILLIIPFALFNHFSQGKLYQAVFRILGDRFRTKSMMRLSLELNFVNNVFPSAGVSGFSYLSIRMRGEEVPAGKSTLVQAMRFTLLFMSFQLLLGVGLLLLAVVGSVNNFVIMVAASLATFLFIGTALAVFVISSKRRINGFFTGLTRVLNRIIQLVRPKYPETINISNVEKIFTELHRNYRLVRRNLDKLLTPVLYAFFSNVAEVAAIYAVFLAFGHVVNPGAVILAYAVANFAGVLSVLPGGVGVYEGLMTGVLVATGVPVAISLPVIVTFRVVSMAFQIPLGYYFYQKNLQAPSHL
jgi:uncharacterized protein (TIRG00374 family)